MRQLAGRGSIVSRRLIPSPSGAVWTRRLPAEAADSPERAPASSKREVEDVPSLALELSRSDQLSREHADLALWQRDDHALFAEAAHQLPAQVALDPAALARVGDPHQ